MFNTSLYLFILNLTNSSCSVWNILASDFMHFCNFLAVCSMASEIQVKSSSHVTRLLPGTQLLAYLSAQPNWSIIQGIAIGSTI
jgi:hypothetical protein